MLVRDSDINANAAPFLTHLCGLMVSTPDFHADDCKFKISVEPSFCSPEISVKKSAAVTPTGSIV